MPFDQARYSPSGDEFIASQADKAESIQIINLVAIEQEVVQRIEKWSAAKKASEW